MIAEGQDCRVVPLSGIIASLSYKDIGIGTLDSSLLERHKDYWTQTAFTFGLMLNLFNTKQRMLGVIIGNPHTDRNAPNDLLEFWTPGSTNTIGLYCFKSGKVTFALRDDLSSESGKRKGCPKVSSTGSKRDDARLVADSLKKFAKNIRSDVQINGPTDDEPYVVMTRPQAISIGDYESNEEIIGVVFSPTAPDKHSSIHGRMQLLVRERPPIQTAS